MKNIVFIAFLMVVASPGCAQDEVTHGPGITAKNPPVQKNIRGAPGFAYKDYMIYPMAEFHVKARVLSKENYKTGQEAKLSPTDLALGWGYMSDERVLKKIHISQGNRWYRWRTRDYPPIPQKEIIRNSANMHIIPASDQIKEQLKLVRKGHIVEFRGKLVRVQSSSNWSWSSSMTREDSGGHACELVWVEEFSIVEPAETVSLQRALQ